METIQKERIVKQYDNIYIANDGTEFNNEQECLEYENTAKCAINTKYKKLVLEESSEYSLFDMGSDDSYIDVVKPATTEDVETIMQMYFMYNPQCRKKSERNDVYNKATLDHCDRALKDNDILFIYRGYEYDSFGIQFTRNEYIEKINKICNEVS